MDTLVIANNAIEKISNAFPSLRMERNENAPVELSITLPQQKGLKQKIWLCLQNGDELHFQVGHFWLSWFPCTDESITNAYIETVIGYLSGKYRVYEHYRGKRCVKSELQMPRNGSWKTIATSGGSLGLPIPWKKTYNELRNA